MTAGQAVNDERFSPAPVRVLTLNAGAARMTRDQEAAKNDELWVGSGFDADGRDIGIVIRLCAAMPTAAELVCAVIGRAVGLPIPEPFLVETGPRSFPRSRFGSDGRVLRFASEHVGGDTFQQLLNARSGYAERLLSKWAHLLPVVVFDEWMANPDRNLGNILYVAGALYLIDHAEAFGSSQRRLYALAELTRERFPNVIGDMLRMTLDRPRAAQHLEAAKTWIAERPGALALDEALEAANLVHVLNAETRRELLDFVRSRLALTHSLLCHRFGMPQLDLTPTARRPAS